MDIYKKLTDVAMEQHTQIFWEYCSETELQVRILYLLAYLAQTQDKASLIAQHALNTAFDTHDERTSKYKDIEEIQRETVMGGRSMKALSKVVKDLYRNMFVRNMENFETYLSDLLAEVYMQRPEMLKSKETLTLEEILQFEDKNELMKFAAENRIMRLQMQGLRAVNSYVLKQHGLKWFSEEEESVIDMAIANRNLIVHNKSRINYVYKKVNKQCEHDIGVKIDAQKFADEQICSIIDIASKIDRVTSQKMSLKLISFEDYKKSLGEEYVKHICFGFYNLEPK